jgi:hypothetical protein
MSGIQKENLYKEKCSFCTSPVCTITNENPQTFYAYSTHTQVPTAMLLYVQAGSVAVAML